MIPLAIGSERRLDDLLPAVPTAAETLPGFTANSWIDMLVPSGADDKVVAALHAAVTDVLKDASVKNRLKGQGFVIEASAPAVFAALIKAESDRWGAVIKEFGIAPTN